MFIFNPVIHINLSQKIDLLSNLSTIDQSIAILQKLVNICNNVNQFFIIIKNCFIDKKKCFNNYPTNRKNLFNNCVTIKN